MKKRNKSFFERLTGAVRIDDSFEDGAFEEIEVENDTSTTEEQENSMANQWAEAQETETVGELAIDMYQTPTHIIIKTIAAGVRPEDLDIKISHDRVTIEGRRENERTIDGENFYHKELYWGAFARTVLLPEEVEADEVEAIEKYGLIIIKLPKKNKHRQTKVQIKRSS